MKGVRQKMMYLLILCVLASGGIKGHSTAIAEKLETATFGGGCFWCTEHDFDQVKGVLSTTSGYTGGHKVDPTYQEVSSGGTGHAEVVQVVFDPTVITYEKLIEIFWRSIDPTVKNRQFCDHGDQYRSAIFYHSEGQKKLALSSKKQLMKNKPFKGPIETEITKASTFYPAEEYHQDFHHKNPVRYKIYRLGCGRDQRLKMLWGDQQ